MAAGEARRRFGAACASTCAPGAELVLGELRQAKSLRKSPAMQRRVYFTAFLVLFFFQRLNHRDAVLRDGRGHGTPSGS